LFGWSVSSAGDVNNDTYADALVGALLADPGGRAAAGAVYVIFGRVKTGFTTVDFSSDFVSGVTGYIIKGAAAGDGLGASVSGAGDVNKDGFDDVIVGAPKADPNNRASSGAAYVIFGKASGFVILDMLSFVSGDTTGYIMQGAAAIDNLGDSVSGAGDVNGDGFDDMIVGAYGADPNDKDFAGAAYMIYGKASGFATLDMNTVTFTKTTGYMLQVGV
jgi:hypothetical protein